MSKTRGSRGMKPSDGLCKGLKGGLWKGAWGSAGSEPLKKQVCELELGRRPSQFAAPEDSAWVPRGRSCLERLLTPGEAAHTWRGCPRDPSALHLPLRVRL